MPDAEVLLQGALQTSAVALGRAHPAYLDTARGLAGVLCDQGKLGIAAPLLREASDGYTALGGDGHQARVCLHALVDALPPASPERAAAGAELAAAAAHAMRIPHPHPLERVTGEHDSRSSSSARPAQWCFACGKPRHAVSFQCARCCFLLCEACFGRWQAPTQCTVS
jgi:hypothetical protein